VVLLREAYIRLNELAIKRLSDRGHGAVRSAHGAVFQYLDDDGTTVSALAERARMTKQAMAELVLHLEKNGYVVRVPDPSDRRAKLVQPTERGKEVIAIAQELVPEIEQWIDDLLGATRARQIRRDLAVLEDAARATA
jgi:DNA-binding MarR family transcriptional regulator